MNTTVTTDATKISSKPASRNWSVNQVHLIGRLAADPTVRDTTAGPVASLRLATNNTRVAEFHDVVLWGKNADGVQGLTKGNPVTVQGRLRTRTWTGADGHSRRATEIVASAVMPFIPE